MNRTATHKQGATYTAHIGPDVDDPQRINALVVRDIPAGICGPCSIPVDVTGFSLDQVRHALNARGYTLAAEPTWTIVSAYDGMRLSAPVLPR